jgi:hypothetical protein
MRQGPHAFTTDEVMKEPAQFEGMNQADEAGQSELEAHMWLASQGQVHFDGTKGKDKVRSTRISTCS